MKYVQLGESNVQASTVALGVMRMDGKSRAEAGHIVETAIETHINFFDTADCYHAGESSRKLGQALKDTGVERNSVFVQTKVGIVRDQDDAIARYDFSQHHLTEAVDQELGNLQSDYIDFLLLHRPDTLVNLEELAQTFHEMESSGKVRHFGVSNVNPMQIEMLQSAVEQKLEVNQLQFGLGHTSMLQQEFHVNMGDDSSLDRDGGLISYSRLKHMSIQAWSPFQYGFFEGVFLDNPQFPELNAKLDDLASKYGVSTSAIAVAWILRHPAGFQVLLGSMNPERIRQMAAGADLELSAQEWYELYTAAGNNLP